MPRHDLAEYSKKIDRARIEDLFKFKFVGEAGNVILVGPNGTGKTMIARNLAHQAALAGHTVLVTTASAMLNDLAAQDGATALKRRISRFVRPAVLVVDELGYLSYDSRHADLLFEIVTRRYQAKSLVVTTNKPFAEWHEVFPHAACTVALIDRLVHQAEILSIEGESYRLREAKERAARESTAKRRSRR